MYQKNSICIETYEGLLVIDGWQLKDEDWNGWAIPVFAKPAADAIAEVIGLDYNAETKTYTDTLKSAGDTDFFDSWTIGFNDELGQETVAIGAASWCWCIVDEKELKDLTMTIIDRRTK